jgi:ankyrin repeat protein
MMDSTKINSNFFDIIKNGDLNEIVSAIAKYKLDLPLLADETYRDTPLFYVSEIPDANISFNILKYFVENGVKPEYTDVNGQTALFHFFREGKLECSKYLIEKGCNINHTDRMQQTPLFYAAREGHSEFISEMIKLGAEVDKEDNKHQTALFYAVSYNKLEACSILIMNHANVNKQNSKKETPLTVARANGHYAVVELLIAHNAVSSKDSKAKDSKKKKSKSSKKKCINKIGKRLKPDEIPNKKYTLSKLVNGSWIPLVIEEAKDLEKNNPEMSKLICDLSKSGKIKMIEPTVNKVNDDWDKTAKKILNYLWKINGASLFHLPVDPDAFNIPDYPEVVKRPMDFGTIKNKLMKNEYKCPALFIEDLELVFDNCTLYNGEDSEYGAIAREMKRQFRERCLELKFE